MRGQRTDFQQIEWMNDKPSHTPGQAAAHERSYPVGGIDMRARRSGRHCDETQP
jgi:hypothetical protein